MVRGTAYGPQEALPLSSSRTGLMASIDCAIRSLGLHRSLFFDAETRLLIASVVAQLGAGRTLVTEQIYSDFRVVHGVKFPFTVRAIEYNHQNFVRD
jgi:hypothetical protein